MDVNEAGSILQQQIRLLRQKSYSELKEFVDHRVIQDLEIVGASGTRYQVEVEAFWDTKKRDNIRVLASIDDGRIRTFIHPLTRSFIKAPDGSFVGE